MVLDGCRSFLLLVTTIFNLENTRRDRPRNIGEAHLFSRTNFVNMTILQPLSFVSHFLRHVVRDHGKDLPPRKDYLLGPTRRCEEYTVYLCGVVNTREWVLLKVDQYFL